MFMCIGFLYVLVQTGITGESPLLSLETESTPSKTIEEMSLEKPVHEKEETDDPITEDTYDTNNTSSELAYTQVMVKHT